MGTESTEMGDAELIAYCEIHCETDRALFSGKHVTRMVALAGYPDGYLREYAEADWIVMKSSMRELCRMARERMRKDKPSPELTLVGTGKVESGWGMVMSFVDGSEKYVLGFEAGIIWAMCKEGSLPTYQLAHSGNIEQFRLIAQQFKCDMHVDHLAPDWIHLTFTPMQKPAKPKLEIVGKENE